MLGVLDGRARALEELAARAGQPVDRVAALLVELELLGLAERRAGDAYVRRNP